MPTSAARFRFTDRTGQVRTVATVDEIAAALSEGSLDGAATVEDLERGTSHPAADLATLAEASSGHGPFSFNWAAALTPFWLAWRGMWLRQLGSFVAFGFVWIVFIVLTLSVPLTLILTYALLGLVHGSTGNAMLLARALQARLRALSRGLSGERAEAAMRKAAAPSAASALVWGTMGSGLLYLLAVSSAPHHHDHERAYLVAMKSDLRNLITAEESYFADNVTYTTSLADMQFTQSSGVTIRVLSAGGIGWSATASHNATDQICGIFVGNGAPPLADANEGEPKCERRREQ